MTGLQISTRTEGRVALLTLMGEARVEGIPALEAAVQRVQQAGAKDLLFDLGRLHFMDSASAGTLMRISKDVRGEQGKVVLYGVNRLITRMIDATGLRACFDVAPDEPSARAFL